MLQVNMSTALVLMYLRRTMYCFFTIAVFASMFACGRLYKDPSRDKSEDDKIAETRSVLQAICVTYSQANIMPPEEDKQEIGSEKKDPWGNPFVLEYYKAKPTIRSAGPDGLFYTNDDIYIHY